MWMHEWTPWVAVLKPGDVPEWCPELLPLEGGRAPRCQESRLPPDSNLNPTQPPFPTTSLLECKGQGMVFPAVGTVIKISIKGNALPTNHLVSAVN